MDQQPVKPKRIGIAMLPSFFGLGINFSWAGAFYEDYGYQRRYKYLDIRVNFLFWMAWVQIPIRQYGVMGVVK